MRTSVTKRPTPKLVKRGEDWAVCIKATGSLAGRPGKIIAWLYAHDESFFCEVGEADQVFELPEKETTNFFGDQFTFAVDETDAAGAKIGRLAGANNVTAANAAFHAALAYLPPQRHIMLRQGGRVLMRGHDLKVLD